MGQCRKREFEKSAKTKSSDRVEQDFTMGSNFACCSFCQHGILLGSAFYKPCSVPQNGGDTDDADFQFSKNEGETEWKKPATHRNTTTLENLSGWWRTCRFSAQFEYLRHEKIRVYSWSNLRYNHFICLLMPLFYVPYNFHSTYSKILFHKHLA